MVSDVPVTPSKVIDQVWHEHQLFTQGYRSFCSEILGRHFDHHPELIPADEQLASYQEQYRGTLALYREGVQSRPAAGYLAGPEVSGGNDYRRGAPATTSCVVKRSLLVR